MVPSHGSSLPHLEWLSLLSQTDSRLRTEQDTPTRVKQLGPVKELEEPQRPIRGTIGGLLLPLLSQRKEPGPNQQCGTNTADKIKHPGSATAISSPDKWWGVGGETSTRVGVQAALNAPPSS